MNSSILPPFDLDRCRSRIAREVLIRAASIIREDIFNPAGFRFRVLRFLPRFIDCGASPRADSPPLRDVAI